jgi:DNA-binding CsgD family transcriptional regulator
VERARMLGSLAHLLEVTDRFAEARDLAEEAVAIARKLGARVEEANARSALGGALIDLGDADAGLAELQAAHRLATQAGDVILVLRATVNHADGLVAAGRLEQAATVALDGLGEAHRLGLARFNAPMLASNATQALLALGRWDQAEQVSRQALETAPSDPTSVYLLLNRAALELSRGDLDRAQARLQTVRRLLPAPILQAERAGPLFCGLAELALWRGHLEQAKQLVAEAVPQVEANPRYAAPLYALGLRVEADRAELARARHPGQVAPGDGAATALLDRLHRDAAGPAAVGLSEVAAWQSLGLAEQTRQQGRCAPAAWAAAVAAWGRLGQPYRMAYAGFRQAEALLAAGDRDTAAVVLARAAEVTGRLGARLLDGEVQALARRARLLLAGAAAPAAGAATPAARLGLTPREAEVLALVAAGHSNRQIAQALFISPNTAGVHVSNILAKLGVAGRVEAAAIAHRLGLD